MTDNRSLQERLKDAYPAIKAYMEEGKGLQYSVYGSEWRDFIDNQQAPGFYNEDTIWRIRPSTLILSVELTEQEAKELYNGLCVALLCKQSTNITALEKLKEQLDVILSERMK